MAHVFVLDTHTLIWYITGSPRLGSSAKLILDDAGSTLVLPAIVLVEACWIVERGRTPISSVSSLIVAIESEDRLSFAPLDRQVVDRSLQLTTIGEMHDRLIVATVLAYSDLGHSVSLLTRDEDVARSGLVRVVW